MSKTNKYYVYADDEGCEITREHAPIGDERGVFETLKEAKKCCSKWSKAKMACYKQNIDAVRWNMQDINRLTAKDFN